MVDGLDIREIPLDRIRVLNPRTRGRRSHDELVQSIERVGLKRPITVSSHISEDGESFDLVCGQGRLEAYKRLEQTKIPAIILEIDEKDCLLRSLVENVARRKHRGADLVSDILTLRERGYSDDQIASKIGVSEGWVSKVALLLERGERDLINAIEAGFLPVSLAVAIACEPNAEIQKRLVVAYQEGALKGGDVARVRRMLDRRYAAGTPEDAEKRANELIETLQKKAERHRLELKRAEVLRTQLAFVIQALRELRASAEFVEILGQEGLGQLPGALSDRVEALHV